VAPLRSAPVAQTPFPPVGVILEPIVYDAGKNEYTLTIRLAGADFVNKLQMLVAEAEGGRQVPSASGELIVDRREGLAPTVDGTLLQADRKYTVWIRAVDHYGEFILKRDEEGRPEGDDPTILAQLEFTHEPPTTALPIQFAILSAQPDDAFDQLVIKLDMADAEVPRVRDYTVTILNQATGGSFDPISDALPLGQVLANREIRIDLPAAMRAAGPVQEYQLIVELATADNLRSRNPEPFPFQVTPPAQPSFWGRLRNGIAENPWIVVTFVLVALSVPAYYALHKLQEARRLDLPPRPPMSNDTQRAGSRGRTTGLFLAVLETPARADQQQQRLTQFPCTIGRQGCDVNFPGDEHLSRTHLQLTRNGSTFSVSDLGSRNGTFLHGQRLEAKRPIVLQGPTELLLGKCTRIRIEPLD